MEVCGVLAWCVCLFAVKQNGKKRYGSAKLWCLGKKMRDKKPVVVCLSDGKKVLWAS
jgi:hypothetical protein